MGSRRMLSGAGRYERDNEIAMKSRTPGYSYVPYSTAKQNATWDTTAGTKTSADNATVSAEDDFGVHASATAISVRLMVKGSSVNHRCRLGTGNDQIVARVQNGDNLTYNEVNGIVNLDSSGDFTIAFSGTVTMEMWIHGYYT